MRIWWQIIKFSDDYSYDFVIPECILRIMLRLIQIPTLTKNKHAIFIIFLRIIRTSLNLKIRLFIFINLLKNILL